jgi:serine kinase of HPr protein (carbohydrate metabolism regulator)
VADDAPEVYRLADGLLYGQCPDSIFGMLHTRSDGFVDVQAKYGVESLRNQCRVDAIIAMSGIAHFGRLTALQTLIGGAATNIRLMFLPALTCDEFGARDVERALLVEK